MHTDIEIMILAYEYQRKRREDERRWMFEQQAAAPIQEGRLARLVRWLRGSPVRIAAPASAVDPAVAQPWGAGSGAD